MTPAQQQALQAARARLASKAASQQESGIMDELGRQLGRTGRMAISGAASVLDTPRIITDPLYTAGYYGAKALGADDAKEFFRQELARPTYGTMAKEKVDELTGGVLKPRNTTEKVTDVVGDVGFSVIAGDKGVKGLKAAMTAPIWDDVSSGGKKAVDTAKTIAAKRAASSARYNEALASGVVFPNDFSQKMAETGKKFLPKTEFQADLVANSPSLRMATLVEKYQGKPLTIEDIDLLDKKLTDEAFGLWSSQPSEARKISEIQDSLRETLKSYPVGGQLAEARDLWAQQAKLRDLTKIQEIAEMTDNPQTSIRTAVKNLIKNEKRLAGYTKQEQALLRKATKTGVISGLLRLGGSRLNAIGAGVATGNPLVAGAVYGAGSAARAGATALQNSKLNKVIRAVENRPIGEQAAPVMRSPLSREEIQALSAANVSAPTPSLTDKIKNLAKDESGSVGGLPDDYASRMARAKAMGFDVDNPVYHGTSEEAYKAIKLAGFNDKYLGKSSKANPSALGHWMVDDVEYAKTHGDKILKLTTSMKNPKIYKRQEWEKIIDSSNNKEDFFMLRKRLESEGYDGIKILSSVERLGKSEVRNPAIVAVFNPKNIRSVNAKFDPSKANSADLLAARAPLAVSGAGGAAAYALSPEDAKAEDMTIEQRRAAVLQSVRERLAKPQPDIQLPATIPDTLPQHIKENEGYSPISYKDTTGNTTVGHGINLDSGIARKAWKQAGIQTPFDDVYNGKAAITPQESAALGNYMMRVAVEDADAIYPKMQRLSAPQQEALTELAYNLGRPRLAGMRQFNEAINKGDKINAIRHLMRSKWVTQVGKRRARQIASKLLMET